MKEYYFDVKKQYIEGPKGVVFVAGSAEIYSATFHFDSTWDGFSKTAVFKCGSNRREQLLVNNSCIIPWETLEAGKYLCIGVYGVSSSAKMPTVYSDNIFVLPGAEPSEAARSYSPDILDQIIAIGDQAAEDAEAAEDAKDTAVAALNAFHTPTASATSLASGSPATASYDGQNFAFGIPQGAQGAAGSAGKSAYASAQDGGYIGTEAQFNTDLAAVSSKQSVSDDNLSTTDKTVVGAINELLSQKANPLSVETTLPATASLNTIYKLNTAGATSAAVTTVLPNGTTVGDEIIIIFNNGAARATVTITGTLYPFSFTPSANKHTEINAMWDGEKWSLVANERAVS